MLRAALMDKSGPVDHEGFRYRGTEVSRLEGLSDGVFALAMTLLIVSVEVPKVFGDLLDVIKALPVFAICFVTLMWFWAEHHKYFRRYGLNDQTTIVLNSLLLFVILFYVYPLKFLITLVIGGLVYHNVSNAAGVPMITGPQVPQLFLLYGIGFGCVALVFLLMHRHALLRRADLDLSPAEVVITTGELVKCAGLIAVAGLSIALAYLLPMHAWLAGVVYALISVVEGIVGSIYGRRSRRLLQAAPIEAAAR
jgi:uncharacterized membrane protein